MELKCRCCKRFKDRKAYNPNGRICKECLDIRERRKAAQEYSCEYTRHVTRLMMKWPAPKREPDDDSINVADYTESQHNQCCHGAGTG